jgi:hypothetical protein
MQIKSYTNTLTLVCDHCRKEIPIKIYDDFLFHSGRFTLLDEFFERTGWIKRYFERNRITYFCCEECKNNYKKELNCIDKLNTI